MESGECRATYEEEAAEQQWAAAQAWSTSQWNPKLLVTVEADGEVMKVIKKGNPEACIFVPPPHRVDSRLCCLSSQAGTIAAFCAKSNIFLLFRLTNPC